MPGMSFYILSNYVIEFEGLYVSYKQNPSCEHASKIECGAVITQSIFSKVLAKGTP